MKNNKIKKSKLSNFKNKLDFWATNSEEGGWNISSTDEGSQKMLENENEKQIKIQTGTEELMILLLMRIHLTMKE